LVKAVARQTNRSVIANKGESVLDDDFFHGKKVGILGHHFHNADPNHKYDQMGWMEAFPSGGIINFPNVAFNINGFLNKMELPHINFSSVPDLFDGFRTLPNIKLDFNIFDKVQIPKLK
jgi:hypothetical protein